MAIDSQALIPPAPSPEATFDVEAGQPAGAKQAPHADPGAKQTPQKDPGAMAPDALDATGASQGKGATGVPGAQKAEVVVQVEADAGNTLLPGLGATETERRWGFIRKVYGIMFAQLAITAAVGLCFALMPSLQLFALTSNWFGYVAIFSPYILLIPLYIFRRSHPLNLVLLALWTASLSLIVGLICSVQGGAVVAEALVLTASVVLALTAYTFKAAREGEDFGYMGPMLYASLTVLVVWSCLQILFPLGDISTFIFSLVGALLFSLYIVYDTDSILKRYSYDEFVWASVNLYLDIINLFLFILRLLSGRR